MVFKYTFQISYKCGSYIYQRFIIKVEIHGTCICMVELYSCITTGVYLSLNGAVYVNNSVILITEIGETNTMPSQNDGLQCITDRRPCCKGQRIGEWYFPNGTKVPIQGSGANSAEAFYRNRGLNDGTVYLNRVSTDIMSPTGLFCCVVPDANNVSQSLCANIGKLLGTL